MNTSDYKSFQYLENGNVEFSIFDTVELTNKLKPGNYSLDYLYNYNYEKVVLKVLKNLEKLEDFSYPNEDIVVKLLESFFNKEVKEKINKLGFIHKLGLLYYGAQGTGKSSIVKKYSNEFIAKYDSIVFHMDCEPNHLLKAWKFIESIREIQDNNIIIIFDEFDKFAAKDNPDIKIITDGNRSIDNCLFFATTNHISDISEAIKDRPSRFKHCINIEGFNSQDQVLSVVNNLLFDILSENEILDLSNTLKGKSIDIIKQTCVDKIMNIDNYSFKKERKLGY